MMSSIGFTASRNTTGYGSRIKRILDELPPAEEYITGGCVGGDVLIGLHMFEKYPKADHTVYVPSDRSRVDPWWIGEELLTVVNMPEGSSYKDRNQVIVDHSEMLVAFPEYPEMHPKSKRSGSWQTIRMAWRLSVPCLIHTLKS